MSQLPRWAFDIRPGWHPPNPPVATNGEIIALQGFWGSGGLPGVQVMCMNGKWYSAAQDVPGLGDFSCKECVQVGELSFSQYHQLNQQELYSSSLSR